MGRRCRWSGWGTFQPQGGLALTAQAVHSQLGCFHSPGCGQLGLETSGGTASDKKNRIPSVRGREGGLFSSSDDDDDDDGDGAGDGDDVDVDDDEDADDDDGDDDDDDDDDDADDNVYGHANDGDGGDELATGGMGMRQGRPVPI